ncbi:MAG: carbohydrate ABC transporter permease [Dehalococcoidales bacterium]|nr:carbohydrate ABC transporter permease [Dehalococcoidales bacterium]
MNNTSITKRGPSQAAMPQRRKRGLARRVLGYIGVVIVLLIVMFPFIWLLQMSFRQTLDINAWPPKIFFQPTLESYNLLRVGAFPKSFLNSAISSVVTTVLSMVLGVPCAYALSRARFSSDRQISLWVLATRMAPPIAFTIPFFLAYRYLEWTDTIGGLVLIYLTFNLALVIWMMRVFFDSVPRAMEEAAYIDGASVWGTFLKVTLPLSAPGLGATGVFCFLFAWNDFFYALILTRSEAMTAPVAIVNFMQYEGWEWGKIAAGGTLVMLPVVVFSLLVRNYLVRGLTAGAVKG